MMVWRIILSEYNTDCYECAHCGLESAGEPMETIDIDGEQLDMCCLGCACAAQLLNNFNSESRTEHSFVVAHTNTNIT